MLISLGAPTVSAGAKISDVQDVVQYAAGVECSEYYVSV